MRPPRLPPHSSSTSIGIIALLDELLDRDPSRMADARAAMILARDRMATEGADPEALARLCRRIREIDAHLRRGSQACLKLVADDIE